MSMDHYTDFIQPGTGEPCQLKKGAENQAVTLLRILIRLELITDIEVQSCDLETLRKKLECCQQQHRELSTWAASLLIPIRDESGELFGEEQQHLSLELNFQ